MAGTLSDPIQTFSLQESVQFYDNGKAKTYIFNISVSAKIVPSQSLSVDARHSAIIARQEAIITQINTFKGQTYFEVQSRNGQSSPIKFIPRIKSLTFKEDVWVDFCDYTIEMEADSVSIGAITVPDKINSSEIDESWSVDYNDEDLRFTKVNHKISCKSKDVDSKNGWETSKTEVLKKINNLIPTDIKDSAGSTYLNPSNKLINYSVNVLGGEFSAEVNLTYHDNTLKNSILPQLAQAYHEQTVTDKQSNETLRDSLSIEGTITGLSSYTSTTNNRYDEAKILWETVKSALNTKYATLTITSFSETHDKVKGIITYSYEIENIARPSETGIKNETITVSYFGPLADPLNTYVIHNTIYGDKGPVFQNINMNKAKTMSITIERVGTETKPDTLQYKPTGSMIESDTINFTAQNKKISRTTVFIWADGSTPVLPTITSFDLINTEIPRPY